MPKKTVALLGGLAVVSASLLVAGPASANEPIVSEEEMVCTIESVLVEEAWTETIEHPAVTAEETLFSKTETRWEVATFMEEGWERTGEKRFHETEAAWDEVLNPGQEYIAPTYEYVVVVPAVPEQPAVYETVVISPEVPAQDAVYETVVTEREYKKFKGLWPFGWWDYQWFPANADPQGWTATGEVRTEERLVSPAVPYQPAVTEERLVSPAVPAQPEQGEMRMVDPGQPYIAPVIIHHEAKGYNEYELSKTETVWASEAPEGFEATEETRVIVVEEAWVEEIEHEAVYEDQEVCEPAVVVVPEEPTPAEPVVEEQPAPATPVVATTTNEPSAERLAHTGGEIAPGAILAALGAILGGAILVLRRKAFGQI